MEKLALRFGVEGASVLGDLIAIFIDGYGAQLVAGRIFCLMLTPVASHCFYIYFNIQL